MMSSLTLIVAATAMMSRAERLAFSPLVVPEPGHMMPPPVQQIPVAGISGLAGVGMATVPSRSSVSMQMDQMQGVGTSPANFNSNSGPSRGRYEQGIDSAILVQGGSLRTWSYRSPAIEQVQVVLSTEGRPLDADIELWHGPDNTPCKMRVYVENGQLRPFSAVVETPRGPNTIAVRNIGQIEFPIAANVIADSVDSPP